MFLGDTEVEGEPFTKFPWGNGRKSFLQSANQDLFILGKYLLDPRHRQIFAG